MDDRLKRIEDKLDIIGDRQGEMNVTLGKQHESLKSHMRRTAALETIVDGLKERAFKLEGAVSLIVFITGLVEIYVHFFK